MRWACPTLSGVTLGSVHEARPGDLFLEAVIETLPGLLSSISPPREPQATVIVTADLSAGPGKDGRRVRFHIPVDVADALARQLPVDAATSRENMRRGREGRG